MSEEPEIKSEIVADFYSKIGCVTFNAEKNMYFYYIVLTLYFSSIKINFGTSFFKELLKTRRVTIFVTNFNSE